MYKLSIVNEINGRTFGSTWESLAEKNVYLNRLIAKQSWGKNERNIDEENISDELRSRIISTEIIPQVGTPDSEDYQPERTVHLVKADYVITEEDMSLSKDYRNSQKVIARRKEYRSIEEIVHIMLDYGTDSQEYIDLQKERAVIKAKYPKEV